MRSFQLRRKCDPALIETLEGRTFLSASTASLTAQQPSSVLLQTSTLAMTSGQSVTLTATVAPATATGSITFLENGIALDLPLPMAGSVAALSTTGLASGTLNVTASYSGDANDAASASAPVVITVSPVQTATVISVTASSAAINTSEPLSLTAAVSPTDIGGVAGTGTVSFTSNGVLLGTAPLQVSGTAVLTTTSPLAVGTLAVSAAYTGDANYAPSTSTTTATVNVVPTITATTLTLSSPSVTAGQYATFSAKIAPTAAAAMLPSLTITGSVTFTEDGAPVGSAPLDATGTATLTTNTSLPTGIGSIVASYSGDNSYASSNSSPLRITVTQRALIASVVAASLPLTAVASASVRGYILANLTNELTDSEAGSETGQVAVGIYAAATDSLNTAGDPLVAQVLHTVNIRQGRSVRVRVPITSFPIALSGTYQLLLKTTDSHGNAEVIPAGSAVISPAVIQLNASFVSVPKNVLKAGAFISLSQSAASNVNDLSVFTARVGLSTDSQGQNIVASSLGTVAPAKALVRLGRTSRVKINGWGALLATAPAGSYYLTVTLTDADGNSVLAVSSKTI